MRCILASKSGTRLWVTMGLLLLLGPLQAQESGKGYIDGHDAALRLEAWYEDLPVVLSASRLQQPATDRKSVV